MKTFTLPHPDSYWLPGLPVCAGSYPFDAKPEAGRAKLAACLGAGITCFLDLTEAHEALVPYETELRAMAAERGLSIEYRRLPVKDNGVPTPERMREILDAIDAATAAGQKVYVHCRGGVGRTGTAVGAYLVRRGAGGEDALRQVQALFETMSPWKVARHRAWGSPQTEPQRAFVRGWSEIVPVGPEGEGRRLANPTQKIPPYLRERMRGALVGLAVGDALGTTLEFKAPGSFAPLTDLVGGGPFGLKKGEWTDDTSMALCLAESLIERRTFDAHDQMQRYVRWWREGHLSSTGRCFDIGGTTCAALQRFERTGDPFAGSTDPHSAGNGSLMRLAPVPLFCFNDGDAIERAAESSSTTHAAPVAVDACRYFAALLVGALRGATKEELLSARYSPVPGYWDTHPLHPVIAGIADGSFRRKSPPEIRGTGYVAQTLEAALWAFHHGKDFREGVLLAVNLGDDADTTGAIYGQLAGAFYGESAIPAEWRAALAHREVIDRYAERLFQLAFDRHPELSEERTRNAAAMVESEPRVRLGRAAP